MDQTMKEIPTPKFMLDFFKAVDALDVAGFRRVMAPDLVAVFGDRVMRGVDEYTKGFLEVDSDFVTKHNVGQVWQDGNVFVMHGSADLTKKGAGPETTNHLAPLVNIFWVNAKGKIARHVVSFAPDEKPAGYKS
jgi:ketosteroid isomerase-like protein